MIYPIWPLFVTVALRADMTTLGFIDGVGDAIVSLSQAASGYASDKIRRRTVFVWTGYLFASASRVGYSLSTVWQHLVPFRVLDRSGKMRGAPRDAIVADLSTKENRGQNFGVLRTMDNLGATCGTIVCIALFGAGLLGYTQLFLIAAVPSAIAALLILLLIREARPF
jgi:sugar phosphate permease